MGKNLTTQKMLLMENGEPLTEDIRKKLERFVDLNKNIENATELIGIESENLSQYINNKITLIDRVVVEKVEGYLDYRERLGKKYGIIGSSPQIVMLFNEIYHLLRFCSSPNHSKVDNRNILIEGETGVGKSEMAKIIHEESERSAYPFVYINVGRLANDLISSALFGHVRGAFTGAVEDQKGALERANKGTLFLDNISTLQWDYQRYLLEPLERDVIERVGDGRQINIDIQFLFAANQDLEELIRKGEFRLIVSMSHHFAREEEM